MTAPRPFLAYDRNAPEAKGARILERIEQARALRSTPAIAPAAEPEYIAPANPWDRLSPHSVNQFLTDCQAKWWYRKGLELPDSRGADAALGSAVHAAIAANFRQKIHTRRDLPASEVRARFRSEFATEIETATLDVKDNPADLAAAGEVMIGVYMERAAPGIQPAAVELPVSGTIGGVHAHGYVDVLTVAGEILDTKTRKRKGAASAQERTQVSTYAMITPGASGRARIDTLTKTKTVDLATNTIEVTDSDRRHTATLYQIAQAQMAAGVYAPNRASNLCSRKYCAYWERCVADHGGEVKK